jgi:hypothetical protein
MGLNFPAQFLHSQNVAIQAEINQQLLKINSPAQYDKFSYSSKATLKPRQYCLDEGEEVGGAGCFFDDAGGEDHAAAVVVQCDGEGEDAPGEVLLLWPGGGEQAALGAVDVGLASEADGLDDVAPVAEEGGHLQKDVAADEPIAWVLKVVGGGIVAVLPDAIFVEDLDEDVGANGAGDAGVVEVARIDDDTGSAALGFEGAEGVEEIFDGAVALEEMHVLDAAEVLVEGCGEDDDGDVGATAAEERGDLGTELASAEVVVEDGDVDVVDEFGGLLDGGGGDALVAALAEDGGAEVQVGGLVVEQEDAD